MFYSDIGCAHAFLSQRMEELIDKCFVSQSVAHVGEQHHQTIVRLLDHLPSTDRNDIHYAIEHERPHGYFTARDGWHSKGILPPPLNTFQHRKRQPTCMS